MSFFFARVFTHETTRGIGGSDASPSSPLSASCSDHSPGVPKRNKRAMELDRRRHSFQAAKLGFAALACSSLLAVYRSRGDPATVAFVAGADGAVALLFHFLRRFERGEQQGRGRWNKAAVWLLTTLLTAMFAARVAPLMQPVVASVVWLMAAGTVAAGFWALLLNP